MRVRVIGALIGYGIFSAVACWPQNPEISSQEAPVTFSSRVNLVSVPVVVRDREGRAIGNLRQEDFQLYDKGKLQTITKFTVEKTEISGAAPTPESPGAPSKGTIAPDASRPVTFPERYVAFLFDDVQLSIDDLARARTAAIRMVNESLDPGTRAAIYTTSRHTSPWISPATGSNSTGKMAARTADFSVQ